MFKKYQHIEKFGTTYVTAALVEFIWIFKIMIIFAVRSLKLSGGILDTGSTPVASTIKISFAIKDAVG